jgi:hypothetical protein
MANKAKKQVVPTTDVQSVIDAVVSEVKMTGTPGVTTLDADGHKKTPGRPIDPESPRQKKLVELEVKRLMGLGKRGRPVDMGSERQLRLAEREERAIANGGVVRQGRPPMTEEEKAAAKKIKDKELAKQKETIAAVAKQKLIAAGLWDEKNDTLIQQPVKA